VSNDFYPGEPLRIVEPHDLLGDGLVWFKRYDSNGYCTVTLPDGRVSPGWLPSRFEPLTDDAANPGDNDGYPTNGYLSMESIRAMEDVDPHTDYGFKIGQVRSAGQTLAHEDRMSEYGDPSVSFWRIADMWSAYVSNVNDNTAPVVINAEDVARMLIMLKLSRSVTDEKADTLDDIDGYTECIRLLRGDATIGNGVND